VERVVRHRKPKNRGRRHRSANLDYSFLAHRTSPPVAATHCSDRATTYLYDLLGKAPLHNSNMEPARSNPPRRSSSGVPRPKPAGRAPSSSSTGSRHRTARRDSANDRASRHHDEHTASHRSTRSRLDHATSTQRPLQGEEELSEEPEEWERGATVEGGRKKRRKRDEPMSPIAVVCYVVFFYVIWQILTRSDETEILSHLPLHLQSLSSSHHSDLRAQPQNHYQLPYHLPQIPSPIPNNTEAVSTSRTLFGILMYPFYILVTIVATPFPLLLNALHLLFHVIVTVLYPITATFRLFGRTFILAPFSVLSSAVSVFYPLYVFIAGVIGVGCVLGLGVGWAGKMFLDIIFGRKRRSTGRRRSIVGSRSHAPGSRLSQPESPSQSFRRKALTPSSGEERELIRTPKNTFQPLEEEEDEDDIQYVSERYIGGNIRNKSSYGGSRESQVVGLRQRGARGSTSVR
jgi:hypothetical protein